MTKQEAINAVGKEFKVTALHGGILGSFDIIVSVSDTGIIFGNYTEALCTDCRLKQEQPQQLKKTDNINDKPII